MSKKKTADFKPGANLTNNLVIGKGERVFNIVNLTILILFCFLLFYPLWYVLVASFTDPGIVTSGVVLVFPTQLFLDGYRKILQYQQLWSGYANTLKYTLVYVGVSLCATVPAAYALSRKDMFGRPLMMFIFSFTMFFSGGIIPLFLLLNELKLYNTIWAVVLPTAVNVYNLIVCRSFFESSIPNELLEASRIDGTNDFGFFFRIVLPLSSTIVCVMILFYATAQWNAFMNPLMFLQDNDRMPLQVVLRNLVLAAQTASMSTDANDAADLAKMAEQLKYAIIVVSALPLLVLYPFLQKYFVKGVTIGAVKG